LPSSSIETLKRIDKHKNRFTKAPRLDENKFKVQASKKKRKSDFEP
jgi:hypothetical protein